MNTRWSLPLTFGLFLCATVGCKHTAPKSPPKSKMPITDVQRPAVQSTSRPLTEPRERELQNQIEGMQEQIRILSARTEALAGFHGVRMGPKWSEKVQAAREEGLRPSDRIRYLEATKKFLGHKLEALRDEMKVYEEFQASDPSIPRP